MLNELQSDSIQIKRPGFDEIKMCHRSIKLCIQLCNNDAVN